MDIETLNAFTELASSITSAGLLLFFVMYFKSQNEAMTERHLKHLEGDIQKLESNKE